MGAEVTEGRKEKGFAGILPSSSGRGAVLDPNSPFQHGSLFPCYSLPCVEISSPPRQLGGAWLGLELHGAKAQASRRVCTLPGERGAEGALKAERLRCERVTTDIPAKQEQEICYLERADA